MRLQMKLFFSLSKTILTATITASLTISLVSAQDSIKTVSLAFKKPVRLAYTPFDKVEVLDNRIDTAKFYTYQTGSYPVISLGFGKNAADSIEKYMAQVIKSRPSKEGSLLINIKQLRVCNLQYIPRKVGRKEFNFRMRDNISFTADIFYKLDGNAYKRLLSIDNLYYTPGAEFIGNRMLDIFNITIEMAAIAQDSLSVAGDKKIPKSIKRLQKDVAYFKKITVPDTATIEEINVNTKSSWSNFLIVKDVVPGSGVFLSFDDFRDNKPVAAHFTISHNAKDSLYEVANIKFDTSKSRKMIYAICDSGNLYVPITNDRYQKLERFENTYSFSVPHNLPDMYSILSLWRYSGGKSGSSSGNLLIDLAAVAASAIVDGIITDSANRKISKKGLQSLQYRHCFIDMDSGDFIY